MDKRLADLIRKPWVLLLNLQDAKSCTVVARHWFNKRGASTQEFQRQTGIDLTLYLNHFMEAGGDDAPISPALPTIIRPILIFHRRENKIVPLIVEVKGFLHTTGSMAWVKTDTWEAMLGDQDYLEKNFPKVDKQSTKGYQQVVDHVVKTIKDESKDESK